MFATSLGATKNESGLPFIIWRVRGRSTTPSMMISATWMPLGHRVRASDSASARWPALAWANAIVRGMPRREAVAPTMMMLPLPAVCIAGATSFATANRPSVLTRHDASRSAGVMSSNMPKLPLPAL